MMKDFLKFHLRHNFLLKKEIKKIDSHFQLDALAEKQNKAFLKLIKAAKKPSFIQNFMKKME